MNALVFLDTHAAVFLWEGRTEVFGAPARTLLEQNPLRISPFVRLELRFLRMVGRLVVEADTIIGGLEADRGVELARDGADAIVGEAMSLDWTRDPFDRLIVANARLHDARLITRDRKIRDHYPRAVWD